MIVREIHTDLGLVEYSSIGTGLPILIIHGGHANCHDQLPHKGLDLGNYHLITPSRPGYGKTPLGINNTPKDAANLFIALLDELKISQVVIYGISAGGWTALELAANYPERVKKLLLVSAVTKKWLNEKEKIYKTSKIIFNPKVGWLTWGMVKVFSLLTPALIAKSFFSEFSSVKDVKITHIEIKELTNSLKTYNSKKGFINDIDQNVDGETLRKIKCPTLMLHSKNDNSVSIDHPNYAHEIISHSQLHILENKWGHMLWIGEDYRTAKELITNFISE